MAAASDLLITLTSGILAGLAVWETVRGWVRYRDHYRVDCLVVVSLLAAILIVGPQAASAGSQSPLVGLVVYTLFLAQPYFLFRLVERFHELPALCLWSTLASAVVGGVIAVVIPPSGSTPWTLTIAAYFLVSLSYAARAFGSEAAKAAGVGAKRLWYAAVGTWLHAAIAIVFGAEVLLPALQPGGPLIRRVLGVGVFVCYYVGLVGPRRLRASWASRELYRHVRDTSDRLPEERARVAPADLVRSASQGLASTATAVFLFDEHAPDVLMAVSATDPAWAGLPVTPGAGLVGQALRRGLPVSGPVSACESVLARRAAAAGSHVVVVPIRSDDRTWGVVATVQRHGSLFPEDDLELLEVLARHAATSLDHGRLVAADRDRRQRAADARLRDQESQFGLILESISDCAVVLLDDRGRVVEWKAGAESIFGYRAEEIVGQSAARLFGRELSAFQSALADARRTGQWSDDRECRRRDGAVFLASTIIRPTRSSAGSAGAFVVVTRDETERRAMADRLRQSQKMEAVGQLARGIAHDFNNLLGTMLGYASLVKADPALPPSLAGDLNEIIKAVDRASGLTGRLLTFSSRQALETSKINLRQVVEDLLLRLRRATGHEVDTLIDADVDAAWVLGVASHVEQLVLNLALNARDAMPAGGRLTIRIGRREFMQPIRTRDADLAPGTYVTLTVDDAGAGMDEAVLSRIFEPFFTTKDVGRGTGLGLATVYGIVQQMSGGVAVTSALGRGTTFRFYFPAVAAPEPVEISASDAIDRVDGSETILVVDDEDAIRRWLALLLTRGGYSVIEAGSPAEAKNLMKGGQHVDLVVTDVMMPGGTGPELVADLFQSRPALKALYVSGHPDPPLDAAPPAAGLLWLRKPFPAEELLRAVRSALTSPRSAD